jgi:hypothetical protein
VRLFADVEKVNSMSPRARDYARIALGAIRLFNGGVALLAPQVLARQLGVDPDASPGTLYFERLFGVRTVIIGLQLLWSRPGKERSEALRLAVIIHASDTFAAVMASMSGKLPGNSGVLVPLISAINTLLAVLANWGEDER